MKAVAKSWRPQLTGKETDVGYFFPLLFSVVPFSLSSVLTVCGVDLWRLLPLVHFVRSVVVAGVGEKGSEGE